MDRSKDKNSKKPGFERKQVNGKNNPKYVDLLEEDKPIAGQKFVCVSFVSPEKTSTGLSFKESLGMSRGLLGPIQVEVTCL